MIFFDAASGLIIYHQSSLAATDTLISKRQFEQEASQCGVSIESYHADNGISLLPTGLSHSSKHHKAKHCQVWEVIIRML
jgi:hypothetical protein